MGGPIGGPMKGAVSILYTLSDALRSIRANFTTAILSSLTVAFALAIFSLFLLVFINLNTVVETWGERTHIVVYIKDGGEKAGVKSLKKRVAGIPGVKDVKYVSKDEALKALRAELRGQEGILEGIGSNPLPASFEIKLSERHRTPEGVKATVKKLERMDWVDDVQYGAEWVEKFSGFLKFLELSAIVVGVFLAAATLFIISNTIRLTVYARKEEIEIMRYLGATNAFIKVPFLVEGMLQGLFGAGLALGMLLLGRHVVATQIPPYLGFVLVSPVAFPVLLGALVGVGVALGVAGSLVSMGRFLKV
jgi:cell division transport system permease protein